MKRNTKKIVLNYNLKNGCKTKIARIISLEMKDFKKRHLY